MMQQKVKMTRAPGLRLDKNRRLTPMQMRVFGQFDQNTIQADLALWQRRVRLLVPALDGLGRVLQDVGQHLRDLAAIAVQRHRMAGKVHRVADAGIAVALQEQGLLAQLLRILLLHGRPRHTGE